MRVGKENICSLLSPTSCIATSFLVSSQAGQPVGPDEMDNLTLA